MAAIAQHGLLQTPDCNSARNCRQVNPFGQFSIDQLGMIKIAG